MSPRAAASRPCASEMVQGPAADSSPRRRAWAHAWIAFIWPPHGYFPWHCGMGYGILGVLAHLD